MHTLAPPASLPPESDAPELEFDLVHASEPVELELQLAQGAETSGELELELMDVPQPSGEREPLTELHLSDELEFDVLEVPQRSDVRPSELPLSDADRAPFAALRSDPPPNADGLSEKDIDIVFQPIVSILTRRVFAYEALTRCRWPSLANPETLFRRASEESCCGRLGRMVRAASVQRAPGVPLFVNVHPDELSARWLVRPDDPVFFHDHDVYVEITESAAFTHYEVCVNVLREIQSRAGIFLAVDDLGAGHSNLKRVLDLEPRIVKLDRALITGLDQNPRQQILVRHVVRLCVELGAEVVAEGIETADELSAVVDLGCHYAQGYLLGRPSYPLPPGHWPED
jgi:EAL domain-containing protein (putative c-di-GMP-specific phosphodiesterase class I)